MTERTDESIGAVPLPTSPADKANAMMKAETKAKRRVTLSICGLGMLDETEIETIAGAHPVPYKPAVNERPVSGSQGAVLEPSTEEALREMGDDARLDLSDAETPPAPYLAKLRTAHTVKEVNEVYAAIPEELKQDCHSLYFDRLKELGKKK